MHYLALGLNVVLYCPSELRELVKMHGTHEKSNEEPLSYDEVLIVKVRITKTESFDVVDLSSLVCISFAQSALEMRDKAVKDVMTPIESVYMLEVSGAINRKVIKEVGGWSDIAC